MRSVIAVYVENKYGVLSRVSGLFMRKGFNIDSLTVGDARLILDRAPSMMVRSISYFFIPSIQRMRPLLDDGPDKRILPGVRALPITILPNDELSSLTSSNSELRRFMR